MPSIGLAACLPDSKARSAPADVLGNAVKIMRIATDEEPVDYGPEDTKDQAARVLGKKVGAARAAKMTGTGSEIARAAAEKRWRNQEN